jgi:hypothetical protein
MARKWTHHLLAAALLALAGSAAGGCNLVLGIHELPDTGAGGGKACKSDLECDSQSACATSACKDGVCESTPLPDGKAPASTQIAFDCRVFTCIDGLLGQQDDDQDIPDDGEQCTVDSCSGGKPFHTAKPHTAGCSMGASNGLCSKGVCEVLCVSDTACDDKNPCTQDACDPGISVCIFTPLDAPDVPGMPQIPGDCQRAMCTAGVVTQSNDDADAFKTATDCDQELCLAGVPSNPPLADTVSCGLAKDQICDGAGACVACNVASQCPGSDSDCQTVTCTGHVCGISFKPLGTPRAAAFQAAGDCHVVVCDGAGASAPQVDDLDLPDDGNNCTNDVCTAGVISHSFKATGTGCGVNGACTPFGQCGCGSDLGCQPPQTCGGGSPGTPSVCGCTPKSCLALNKTCGTVTDGCFSTQNCNNGTKEGNETDIDCGGGAAGSCGTTCAIGKQCLVDTDCGAAGVGHCADGVCCNSACTGTCQACSSAKKGAGADGMCGSIAINLQDPNATVTCVGNNVCDGANHCKKIDGQTCSLNSECVNGNCADGVCCNTACTGTCLACSTAKKGSGVDGVCGNIAVNQPDTTATVTCTGTSACDGAGFCKKNLGQPCANNGVCANGNCVDGFCCGAAGGCPACQSCAIGANGTCGNILAGNPDNVPVNACAGTNVCDGMGACKMTNGQPCGSGTSCLSGNCADNVCCNTSCNASNICMTCVGTLPGVCSMVVNADDSDSCNGSQTCDSSGACLLKPGQACLTGAVCASGVCSGAMICQ